MLFNSPLPSNGAKESQPGKASLYLISDFVTPAMLRASPFFPYYSNVRSH